MYDLVLQLYLYKFIYLATLHGDKQWYAISQILSLLLYKIRGAGAEELNTMEASLTIIMGN